VDADHIVELFAGIGPVRVRRMFGGLGVYADDTMFALVTGGVIHLKTDGHTVPDFEREGLKPFTYVAKGDRLVVTSYWRMPDRLYDDPDELARWARLALGSARRAAERKASVLPRSGGKPRKRPHQKRSRQDVPHR
jgi:DNA transformation protein and related proteins